MSGEAECQLSSSTDAISLDSATTGRATRRQCKQPLSKKRSAARCLPPISFTAEDPSKTVDSSADASDYCTQEGGSVDLKKPRLLDVQSEAVTQANDHFPLSELSESQSKSPVCCPIKNPAQNHRCWPDVNNKVIGDYHLVGAGKNITAFHMKKKVVMTCQLIDDEQFRKLLRIKQRLMEAEKYWKHNDLDEMREFVLPPGTEICRDANGQRYMISAWHYGTLHSKVQADKVTLTEAEVFALFSKIVRGVAFCHACGIVLRDVKLRKFVFIDKQMTELRLHDVFGMHICDDINNDRLSDRHSCPAYVAPEILLKNSVDYAGRPADIWALGVLLFVLLCGNYPFHDITPQKLFCRILKAKFCIPPHLSLSQTARVLVYDMLRKEPSKRPTAEQLLRVPLMVEEDSSKLDAVVPLGPDSLGETKQIASGATSAFGSNDADESAREFLALLLSANEDQVVPSISTTFRIVIQRDV